MTHKDSALEFMRMVCSNQVSEAFAQFVAADFRHHNAFFPSDGESLRKGMEENAKEFPQKRFEAKHVIGEDTMVMVHGHVVHTADELGFALAHVFRFEGEKIAEMWDIAQEVPKDSPNELGMF
jgi:predicted SnoaL-like aldol condensation-catalyzing enzyme